MSIYLLIALIAYHFSKDNSNDSEDYDNDRYQDNLKCSIETKQEKCFELLLDLQADPLRKLETAYGNFNSI
mgnify:CR=1 FL=1